MSCTVIGPTRTDQMHRRRVIWLLAASVSTLVFDPAHVALGARGWCRSDPLVMIDEQLVYAVYSAPQTIRKVTTGPVEVVISIPHGVKTDLIAPGPGFGSGESVSFIPTSDLKKKPSSVQIQVAIRVPASQDLPTVLECAPRTRAALKSSAVAEGATNDWLILSSTLERIRDHPAQSVDT